MAKRACQEHQLQEIKEKTPLHIQVSYYKIAQHKDRVSKHIKLKSRVKQEKSPLKQGVKETNPN